MPNTLPFEINRRPIITEHILATLSRLNYLTAETLHYPIFLKLL